MSQENLIKLYYIKGRNIVEDSQLLKTRTIGIGLKGVKPKYSISEDSSLFLSE